ncbi:relaxase/mobilization nuclease domain-containing protein [Clostridium perfringens]|uniref:relaxase/mobilization nuclease domain-containing protein n=1 Tax=Clostridium perfringens TaxID=1502 RepID=UPI00224559B1|nr:relaxase/mobilization nuclease domain-containing protein [Clostridium perfringens]MCX0403531.1 relaxase/mobilization nuclease domain-containing protein [Clostridium perfringens]
MAYVKRHPIKKTVNKSISYILDEKKTDGGILVYGINCSINPKLATKQMKNTREYYGKDSGNLAYHFIQSFKPGEIKDVNTAYEIGIKLAEKITDGKYKAVISTHTDKKHIHNHIIINSVSDIDGKKFNSCKKEYENLKQLSNEITKEYNLSIIKEGKGKGKSYKEWKEDKKGTSWKSKIRNDIDEVISKSKSFEEFIKLLYEKNYEIKYGDNVKHIAFKLPGQQRFARGKTIGEDYTEEKIKLRIEENVEKNKFNIKTYSKKKYPRFINKKDIYKFKYKPGNIKNNITLTILLIKELLKKDDIRNNSVKVKQSKRSIETLQNTLLILNEKNINTVKEIEDNIKTIDENLNKIDTLINKIEKVNSKMDIINNHIEVYKENKSIYDEYSNKTIFTKKTFAKAHKEELTKFNNAKEVLEKMNLLDNNKIENFIKDNIENKNKLGKYKEKRNEIEKNKVEYQELFKNVKSIKDRKLIKEIENDTREKQKQKNKDNRSI